MKQDFLRAIDGKVFNNSTSRKELIEK